MITCSIPVIWIILNPSNEPPGRRSIILKHVDTRVKRKAKFKKKHKVSFFPYERLIDAALVLPLIVVLFLPVRQFMTWWPAALICSAVSIPLLSCAGKCSQAINSRRIGLVFIAFAFSSLLGVITVKSRADPSELIHFGMPSHEVTTICGEVIEDGTATAGGGTRLVVNLKSAAGNHVKTTAKGKITLYVHEKVNLPRGKLIKAQVAPPGEDPAFRFVQNLEKEGWKHPIHQFRESTRLLVLNHINKLDIKPARLFTALFLGIRTDPAAPEYDFFRKSGTMHILALSGMHLGILSGLAALSLIPILGKRRSFAVTIVLVWLYLGLIGPRPSLVRAAIMFTLGAAALLMHRPVNALHILAVTFVIQTGLAPSQVETLSFQLSFLALSGILLFSAPLNRLLPAFVPPQVRTIMAASIGAQIATAPLLAYYFEVLYPIGVMASLVLAPLVTFFMWGGLLFLLLSFLAVLFTGPPFLAFFEHLVSSALQVAANSLGYLYSAIVFCAELLSKFPAFLVPAEKYTLLLFGVGIILTVIIGVEYAGSIYGFIAKLRFTGGDMQAFTGTRACHKKKVRPEFSDMSGGQEKNHQCSKDAA